MKIFEETEDEYVISSEVFGKEIKMWQRNNEKVVKAYIFFIRRIRKKNEKM